MTAAALQHLIGRRGHLTMGGLFVGVTIQDARALFGRVDLLVRSSGSMEIWVEQSKVTLDPMPEAVRAALPRPLFTAA